MVLRVNKFAGMAPKLAPQALPDGGAIDAINCLFSSGALRPLSGLSAATPFVVDGNAKTIWYNETVNEFYSHTTDVDYARSPVPDDSYKRIYRTDGVLPMMLSDDDGYTADFTLGVPAPTSAPTCSIVDGGGPSDDPTISEDRAYFYTFVTAYGEEGPPSPASDIINLFPTEGDTVEVTMATSAPSPPPGGAYNITRKRLYRTVTNSGTTEYQLVSEVNLATATETDDKNVLQLGVICPSEMWDMPPADLRGIKLHPAGFLVGFSAGSGGNDICFSEPGLPHAWPVANRYSISESIVGIALYGTTVLICTTGNPYTATGETPSAMTIDKLEIGGACLSKRCIVDMGDTIIYPSPEGLVRIGIGTGPEVITSQLATKKEWANLFSASNAWASRDGDKYVCFFTGAGHDGLIFDPAEVNLVKHNVESQAGLFYEPAGDLYIKGASGQTWTKKFNSDTATPYEFDWTSKEYRLPAPINFAACQVFADDINAADDLVIHIHANMDLTNTLSAIPGSPFTVSDTKPFRLPGGFVADRWKVRVVGEMSINAIFLAESMRELGGA